MCFLYPILFISLSGMGCQLKSSPQSKPPTYTDEPPWYPYWRVSSAIVSITGTITLVWFSPILLTSGSSQPIDTNGPSADKNALRAYTNGEAPDQFAQPRSHASDLNKVLYYDANCGFASWSRSSRFAYVLRYLFPAAGRNEPRH